MPESGLLDADLARIVEWAKRRPSIKKIYLFGSRARGDHRPDSDIDLAVEIDLNAWFDCWPPQYERAADLQLSHPVQLEWYQPDAADLETVGRAVKSDGILFYERANEG